MLGFHAFMFALLIPNHAPEMHKKYRIFKVTPKTASEIVVLREMHKFVDFWYSTRALKKPDLIRVSTRKEHIVKLLFKCTGIEFTEYPSRKALNHKILNLDQKGINFQQYHRYDKIMNYILNLEKHYKNLVNIEHTAHSVEGRNISMIKISTGGLHRKPIIFIEAGTHAREWISTSMALYIINQLVEHDQNYELIKDVDWYIIPLLNPDGYEYTHTTDRFWRKTRSKGSYCKGVDVNRNFGLHWMQTGASGWECDGDYAGPAPMSEPETKTIKYAIEKYGERIKLYLSLHSYGKYIFYPWGYTHSLPKNWKELHALASDVRKAILGVNGTNYTFGSLANSLHLVAGASIDWVKSVGKIDLVYAIELPGGGNWGFDVPEDSILPNVEETFEGIKVFHKYIIHQKFQMSSLNKT